MKRSLIALAAVAAAAPATAQSTLTLFGVAEAQVGQWRNLVAAPVSQTNPFGAAIERGRTRGLIPYGINASRFGLRGVEDLGAGLAASIVLENQFALDTGMPPARYFHRQANVGLHGGFGQIRMGRIYTAWNDIASNAATGYGDTYDPFVRVWRVAGPVPLGSPVPNAAGQLTGLAGSVGTNNDSGNPQVWAHVRMDNSIRYDTPTMGGITLSAQVQLDESIDGKQPQAQSYAALYVNGPIRAGVGYYTQHTRSFYNPVTGQYDAKAARSGKLETYTAAFNYDFGPVRLVSMAGQSRYDVFSLGKRITSTEWSVGAVVPVNAWALRFSVAGSNSNDLPGRDWGAGAEALYNLSKRSALYGAYSYSKYDELLAGQARRSSYISALGIRHFF